MKSDTRLDSAVFQLTPTRTRCDLVIIANGKTEKIASGLLDPFLAHLKAARDQIAKGGYSITLEPGLRSDAMWFTKDTVERFVRFVSTPEVLERVNTIESEMLQIDEAIVIQGNDNLGLSTVEDDRVKSTETTEGNKHVYDADAEKAIVLFKPGVQPPESNVSTTLEENSKVKLLRVLETRKTVLQKEQGMAFARAVAAGFDMDHMTHLLSFAEYFGASRLMEASIKFMELWKRKHETGQWLEIEATEAMSSRSDFSSINASGIVFSGEVKKQKEFSEARYKPHNELGTEGNGKTSNDATMGSQHLSSDNNGDKRPPLDSQVPLGAPEYFQGHFQHPMYPQWPMHSPSGAPVFQAYPMQGMPYYQASGPFFQSPYPPMEDPRFNGAHRMGQKRHSMDSKDSNVESGASNGRSQDSTDQSTSEKEVVQGHETKRKNGRSGKAKSGMVVIRNINYITSKRDDTSGSESHSASESDEDAEELQSDAPRRKHKNSLRSSKNRGSLTKSTDTWNSNDRDDVAYEQQTDDGNWQAFQNFLLRDGEESTSTVDRGMFSAETEAPIKKRQNTTGADPIIDPQDTSDASHQQFSKFDAVSGNGTRIYKQRVSNDELAISQGHSHGGRVLTDGQLDVQFSEVESGRGGYKRGTNDDFMLYGQRTQSVSNSHSDPLVGNEFGHADNLDKSSSHNVTDESFIVPFRSSPQDQVRSEGRTAIDIDSEFPSNCQIAEDSSHRLRIQLSYEPDVLSLMPVRSTERGSAGYDPAVDYEMEARAEDAIAADNGNQEDGAAVKEGLKKLERGKKSRLQDALEKRKMEAAMRKGKPSKMNHLTEAQVRAERLRAYKADLQKMKREKEEEEMKRLEGLKRERQRRIAARSNTVPAQSSLPSLQSKSRLPAKLSPGSNKGSKFSDAEPGSSSPLQRLPSKVTSAAFNDPQKTAQSSRLNTTRLAGNGLSRSVSSLPDLKKENDAPEPKSVPVQTRRLSDPKGSGGHHASLKSGGSGTLPKPKVPDEPEIKKISALSDPKGSGGHHASLKSGGSGTLPKPKVPDEPEIKKISAIMSLDKTKTATLPELKIRTSRSNSDVTQNKSASKEIKQSGNKSSLAPETIKPKKSDYKIPPYSNGDDNPVIEKTVVMLEHDILAVPALQASVERKEDKEGPYEDASKIDTVEVTEYASIHPPAPPIRICEEDKDPSKLQLDEHSNSNKVIMYTTSDELPKSSNISFSEKPYQAPYARVSSLEDPCTSNSEYNKAPLIGTEMETITETVKTHVSDFTDINSPVLISESLEKSRGRESSKGFRRLLKFGRKNHSSAMGEHGADSDKLSIDSSVIDDHYAAIASSNRVSAMASFFIALLLLIPSAHCFYLPGVAPQDFQKGDILQVKVNKLSSTKTQLPYDYYFLNYCRPRKILNNAENLGEVLRGDRIENSVYTFQMRQEQSCKVGCRVKFDAKSAKNFKEKIDDEYRVNMILDNLPVAVLMQRRDGNQATAYEHGFRVGFKGNYAGSKDEKYFINNHLSFRVMYHKDPESDAARIVGFEVTPHSIKHEYKQPWDDKNPQLVTCTKNMVQGGTVPQEVDKDKEVIFTYDVSFKPSDVKWASRWDTYLLMNDDQIHWFSIINSLMIVLFLSGMVAMIMMRTLYKDIANYNQLETQEEAQEETGWKLVHGDVFRSPTNSSLLCVYVGTGVQFFGMALVTMIFALLGFLSPSNRGGLMTAMVLLWVFMGLFAGYSSARLYKMFKGTEWKKNTLKTAFMFPGIVFSIFFVLNAIIWGEKSSGAVPFGTMFALVFLWFGISVPLVFVGSYLGFKKLAIEDPVKTNKIPRQIPEQAWYMQPVFSILIGGILPFGAVFIELFFILTSIWLNQFYYIFGFLFIVFVILLITCAEITIVLCYFQLCSEDYHWWWRAYLTAGSSALYLFLYSIFYFFTKLEITKVVSGILYFGYMLIVSYAFFVLTGTIGFYACFWFVRKIYASVKID